jgi:hypothetical protein
MHVLAMALLMRRNRMATEQPFPEAMEELVASALLQKARSLAEFLSSRKPNMICTKAFGISPSDDSVLDRFYGFVSQHSVHLDWQRARDPLLRRPEMYEEATHVLRKCAEVCAEIRARGVSLSAERHRKRHEVLRQQLALLNIETV